MLILWALGGVVAGGCIGFLAAALMNVVEEEGVTR